MTTKSKQTIKRKSVAKPKKNKSQSDYIELGPNGYPINHPAVKEEYNNRPKKLKKIAKRVKRFVDSDVKTKPKSKGVKKIKHTWPKTTAKSKKYKEYTVRVYANGDKDWYLNGELHREDGPAIECASGDKYWYLNGKCHRVNGPAVEYANGEKHWYLNGKEYTEAEYNAQLKPSCEGKCVEIEGVKYKLVAV